MRRVRAVLSVAAVVLTAAGLIAQAKPNFAGDWKLDAEGGGRGGPGIDLTIVQSASTMTLEYRAGSETPTPIKLTYALDGSVSKNMMAVRGGGPPTEQISKAVWAGTDLVVTTTTSAGNEKRTFTTDGAYLVVETSAPTRSGGAATVTKVTYKRYERGHGG